MDRTDLVALIGDGVHSRIIVHALINRFGSFPIIMEDGEDQAIFWKRRFKKLGFIKALSLKLAAIPIKLIKPLSKLRYEEILSIDGVSADALPEALITHVPSVNSDEAGDALASLNPKIVFVCSTRVIKPKLLSRFKIPFINYHSGINPAYRGIHGGYHARANGQEDAFGITVHLVDEGVDTGKSLGIFKVTPTNKDTIHTYVPLMAAQSSQFVCDTIDRALKGDLTPCVQPDMHSRQYYGPSFFAYIFTGLIRGIW